MVAAVVVVTVVIVTVVIVAVDVVVVIIIIIGILYQYCIVYKLNLIEPDAEINRIAYTFLL